MSSSNSSDRPLEATAIVTVRVAAIVVVAVVANFVVELAVIVVLG